jgi:peptidoglycan L-alanyl-D-glutamate endopeptidase CwlK
MPTMLNTFGETVNIADKDVAVALNSGYKYATGETPAPQSPSASASSGNSSGSYVMGTAVRNGQTVPAMVWKGGTSSSSGSNANVQEEWDSIAFDGNTIGVVRLDASRPNDLYLIDSATKTIQRFESPEAISAYAPLDGATVQDLDAAGSIPTVSISLLAEDGYTRTPDATGMIKSNGADPLISQKQDASLSSVGSHYGKAASNETNLDAHTKLDGFLTIAQTAGVSANVVSQIRNNPTLYAFYMDAVGYGGYSFNDIYKDLKRRELVSSGNTTLSNTSIISPTSTKTEYAKTAAGQASASNPLLAVPAQYGDISSAEFDLPIYQLSDKAFSLLAPLNDPTSDEFKSEIEKIQSLYYDTILQNLSSNDARTHALAVENWKMLKDDVEKKLGITLADDALSAWDQINNLGSTMSGAGLYESGIHQEARDRMLDKVRRQEDLLRQSNVDSATAKRMEYFVKNATPDEMKNGVYDSAGKLSMAPPTDAEKKAWGLTPSNEDLSYFTLENLRKLAPNESDAYLQAIIDASIDTSTGTPLYRSEANSALMNNRLNTMKEKLSYQKSTVLQNATDAEAVAAKPFTEAEIGQKDATPTTTAETSAATVADDYNKTPAAPQTPSSTSGLTLSSSAYINSFKAKNGREPTTAELTTWANSGRPSIDAAATTPTASSTTPQKTDVSGSAAAGAAKKINSGYAGSSVVDYLKSIGQSSDVATRKKLATEKGISNYDTSAQSNTALLKAMRGY